MNIDITGYESFLQDKHYSESTVSGAVRLAKRILETCTWNEITEKDADQLIKLLGIKPTTSKSRHWYKNRINTFKRYLETPGAYI